MISYCYPGCHLSNNIFTVSARPLVMNFFSVQNSAVGINHSAHPVGSVESCWKLRRSICFILPFAVPYPSSHIVGHLRTKVIVDVSSCLLPGLAQCFAYSWYPTLVHLVTYGLPEIALEFSPILELHCQLPWAWVGKVGGVLCECWA